MKTTTLLLIFTATLMKAQLVIGFETFSLAANSSYASTSSTPFQVSGVAFNHVHSFNLWYEGFSYTNKYDSATGNFNNLYGVRPYKGNNQSATYAVGQSRGIISVSSTQNTITGMYVTNSTYAYKTIRDGDSFSRKFGDTTGTGSGTTIPQGSYPDYFKLIIRPYLNGALKSDSVTFFLADYRGTNDYIVDTWQFVNTAPLGKADSLQLTLRSTDNGQFGMNTPAFFGIDDVQVELPNPVGLNPPENAPAKIWPRVFHSSVSVTGIVGEFELTLTDIYGRMLRRTSEATMAGLDDLPEGVYVFTVRTPGAVQSVKIVKE
jgi:hypothetical protein